MKKAKKFEISDVLTELDFVKRELYEQIDTNQVMAKEKDKAKTEYKDLENQMEETLMSYQQVIIDSQSNSTGHSKSIQGQLQNQLKMNETLQREKNHLMEGNMELKQRMKEALKNAENVDLINTNL